MKDKSVYIATALEFNQGLYVRSIPQTSWSQVAGMRNILAHEYLGVDMVMIWDTVQLHLNDLRQALETIQTDMGKRS